MSVSKYQVDRRSFALEPCLEILSKARPFSPNVRYEDLSGCGRTATQSTPTTIGSIDVMKW